MSSASSSDSDTIVQARSRQSDNRFRARLLKLVVSLVLVVLVFLAYGPCWAFPFLVFDDPDYVFLNPYVQAGLTGESICWAFTTGVGGNWHPLTWLSWQLDATLYGGENAGAFHRTNVLLHAASAVILFLVLCRMTAGTWRSAIVAALFALHPLNVESIAWVSERKNALSTLFWMLALAAYLGYIRRPGICRYLLLLAALTLGLMSKAAVVTLPCVLLLLDYWPLERWRRVPQTATPPGLPAATPRFLVLEKLPLFGLVLGACIITYLVQNRINLVQSLEKYPLDARVLNALQSYVIYGFKLLWPVYLAPFYPHPGESISIAAGLASGALLVVVTLLLLGPGRRRPYLAVGWLWYLGTMVPMIGLVQVGNQALADRYAYLPTIGLFIVLSWGGAELAERMHLSISFQAMVAAIVVILPGVLCRIQVGYWGSDKALWEHALTVTTNNAFAHAQLGLAYSREHQLVRAEKEVRAAVALHPESPKYQYILGSVLLSLGRTEEAEAAFRKAISRNADEPSYRLAIANSLRRLGRNEEALSEYHIALALVPNDSLVLCNLANLLADLGRHREAERSYRKSIESAPTYGSAHAGLARVLAELGQYKEADAEFRSAIELNPENAVTHYNFAMTLQAEGRLEEAAVEYREARELGIVQAASRLRACERLSRLQPRLQRLIAGQDQPRSDLDRLGFAELCEQPFVRRYALAAHLYTEAFRSDPALADDARTGLRTAAAIAAARAGCGQGQDSAALKDEDKAKLRRQSLEWLQAELTRWKQWADRPQARTLLVQTLLDWQKNDGLAGVRETAALTRLPQEEQTAWQKLWREIEAMLAQKNGLQGTPERGRQPPETSLRGLTPPLRSFVR